ncbi:C2 domain-containing protein [Gamsiella multidivaricata]|uniref:C2 domain-containing protein n=1 Tax=Gamsiella multidivaricata TaxID=101098 RepID=UPI00221F19DA|nr:C2 domain-containing protein [Gamsiella multidivaricata]KAG0367151.1 hypothetical protein BGZ54_004326 [Gamsiella multidivaricata]KAI7822672.1 C2 domain-containing protein [Gamsiella multidivaricata]
MMLSQHTSQSSQTTRTSATITSEGSVHGVSVTQGYSQSTHSVQGSPTLSVAAHGASNLKDVETFGKQDPYLRFTLDITDLKSFQKTFVHKNAGKNPVWNQSFNVPLNGQPDLYIEIMDEETTADAIIAFAAIPINQVVHAPGGTMNGIFDVYTADGKQNGQINLTLTVHNVPGQNTESVGQSPTPVKGQSYMLEAHHKRIKSIKNRETAADAGMAVAGGLLALGAGFLANKVIGDDKRKEEERKEAARQQQLEQERFQNEKKHLEEERATFERTKSEEQARIERERQQHQNTSHESHKSTSCHSDARHEGCHDSNKHDNHDKHDKHGCHDDHKKKSHCAREWDPVGNYSPGDKVEYHGRKYVCLQGHQSNPTWEPTEAHSLWRAD